MKISEQFEDSLICWTTCDDTVRIFIYRVLFGYRLRSCLVTDRWGVDIDWCMGAAPLERMIKTATVLNSILEDNHKAGLSPFDGLPGHSQIKPMWNDLAFMQGLHDRLGKIEKASA